MNSLLIDETLTEQAKRLEHYETPAWAAHAILQHEILTARVIDPCCGTGILGRAAEEAGYKVINADIHDWGHTLDFQCDWLVLDREHAAQVKNATVFMNPPFSEAVEFVEQALRLEARKIVCFQRFAWWESRSRRPFWSHYPPNRVYICGDRASCWRHDIPKDDRGGSSTTTAHAWFVWERGQPGGTQLSHIWKDEAA